MKIKVLTPNKDGKFEFTKEELEALLQEAYEEGKNDSHTTLVYPQGIRGIAPETEPWWGKITCANLANSTTDGEKSMATHEE